MNKFHKLLFTIRTMSLPGIMLGFAMLSCVVVSAATFCQCVAYARCASGINIYGNANQWDNLAASYGYRLASRPMVPGVINFEAGAYGADKQYGHVANVLSYQDGGSYWNVRVRHANWGPGTITDSACGCSNVSEKTFSIRKNDPTVHFIYDPRRFPTGVYAAPRLPIGDERAIDSTNPFSDQPGAISIDSDEPEVNAMVKLGQRINLKAKAETDERIWVLIESARFPGSIFALLAPTVCNDGNCLERFIPEQADSGAETLYYSSLYGDTRIDLDSLDFIKLAGINGEVVITIKKGVDPQALSTIQTIRIKVSNE